MSKNNKFNFKTAYWGENNSTKSIFKASFLLPENEDAITSCMGAIFLGDKILLTKPERGWGLPGGRRIIGETPLECIKRECKEEASVTIDNAKVIGYWEAKKLVKLDSNNMYPDTGYQVLFIANATLVEPFKKTDEIEKRLFVKPSDIEKHHHDFENFKEILNYIQEHRSLGLPS